MKEQRQSPRFEVAITAEFELNGTVIPAQTKNVSLTGAALISRHPVREHTAIEVTLLWTQDGIESADQKPLRIKGRIVRTTEDNPGLHTIGLEFEKIKESEAARLRRFLSALPLGP